MDDNDNLYVFGDKRAYKEGNETELSGVILSTFEEFEVANIIYCPENNHLFPVLKSIYVLKKEDSKGLSNNQRKKRQTPLEVLTHVNFAIDKNTVLYMYKSQNCSLIEYHCGVGYGVETFAVLNSDRKLWVKGFGFELDVETCILEDILVDVAYDCLIKFDYNEDFFLQYYL